MQAVSPSMTTFSIITTASNPAGSGWPVLTKTKPSPGSRRTGKPSRAAKVSAARTAMPSMAALW